MRKVREWLGILLVPIVVVAAMAAPAWVTARVNEAQLQINCQSVRTNISQLQALARISRQLGIPRTFQIPEVPDECDGR